MDRYIWKLLPEVELDPNLISKVHFQEVPTIWLSGPASCDHICVNVVCSDIRDVPSMLTSEQQPRQTIHDAFGVAVEQHTWHLSRSEYWHISDWCELDFLRWRKQVVRYSLFQVDDMNGIRNNVLSADQTPAVCVVHKHTYTACSLRISTIFFFLAEVQGKCQNSQPATSILLHIFLLLVLKSVASQALKRGYTEKLWPFHLNYVHFIFIIPATFIPIVCNFFSYI